VSFYPVLPATGQYNVYAWWPAAAGNANNVPINVATASETRRVTVNQQQQGGRWVLLGTFVFNEVPVASDRCMYDAFGGSANSSGSMVNPWQYGGQYGYYQDAPGRSYRRVRHWHPGTGRWMSPNPIEVR